MQLRWQSKDRMLPQGLLQNAFAISMLHAQQCKINADGAMHAQLHVVVMYLHPHSHP